MIYECSKETRIAWEKLKVEKKVVSLQPILITGVLDNPL